MARSKKKAKPKTKKKQTIKRSPPKSKPKSSKKPKAQKWQKDIWKSQSKALKESIKKASGDKKKELQARLKELEKNL